MDLMISSNEMGSAFGGVTSILSSSTFMLLLLLPYMGNFILTLVAKWNILEKAGVSGWAALIPFYGKYCFYETAWDNGWYFLTSYIPGLNYVFSVITMVKLSCRFEKNSVFALGLVVLEPIFLAILGFDDSEYA